MKLTIEFYGRLKAEFSQQQLEFDLPSQTAENTIEDIYLQLCESHNIQPSTHIIKPILNDTFANWGDPVKANDVVGFLPPASGG